VFTFKEDKIKMINIIEEAFGIYSILLIIISTLGSTFSSFVCHRLGKKGIQTFNILSFVFILEATTQYTWILDIFLKIFTPNNDEKSAIDNINIIESFSIPTCKIFTFNQYFSLEALSWLLVYSMIDQNLQLYFPAIKYNLNPKYVKMICWIIIIFFALFNSHILMFAGLIEIKNMTINETKEVVNCFHGVTYGFYAFWPLWDKIHMFVYSFIPFVLMIVCNLFTIKKIFEHKPTDHLSAQQLEKEKKKRILTINLLTSSFLFMACSMPAVLSFGYFFESLSSSFSTSYILPGSDLLNFTFIGLNFLLYFILNKVFRYEFYFCLYQIKVVVRFNYFKIFHSLRLISSQKLINEDNKYKTEIKRIFFDTHIKKTKHEIEVCKAIETLNLIFNLFYKI